MKILVVGSDQIWSIERTFIKHLNTLGTDTQKFAAQNLFFDYYRKSLLNKLLFKTGLSTIYESINKKLVQVARDFKPDIIWFFKGMEVFPKTLDLLRNEGFILANYNPDNPFVFSGTGSGNRNVTNSIGKYHFHFSYDRDIANKITREYNIPCYLLPFGFELDDSLYEDCIKQPESLRLCFIGNPDKERAQIINDIASDFEIDLYGHHWEKWVNHANARCKGAVYGDDYWKTLYRYRIQLNLMRVHNPASHNMRSFEVPGVGGIGLFPDTVDHREYWKDSNVIFLYKDMNELKAHAARLLDLSHKQAQEIRMKAHQHSLLNGHTYLQRSGQVLERFRSYLRDKPQYNSYT